MITPPSRVLQRLVLAMHAFRTIASSLPRLCPARLVLRRIHPRVESGVQSLSHLDADNEIEHLEVNPLSTIDSCQAFLQDAHALIDFSRERICQPHRNQGLVQVVARRTHLRWATRNQKGNRDEAGYEKCTNQSNAYLSSP